MTSKEVTLIETDFNTPWENRMIHKIEAKKRHFTDMGWLKTFWLFSFGDYYDQKNLNHGSLRVYNDDVVEPQTGFDIHPHEEMEIISILLEGEMTHKDTMGNETIIRSNEVQRMTAGSGLYHSEYNLNDVPVHFHQIWIVPDKKGLKPSYDQKTFDPKIWENRLALLASDKNREGIVHLNTSGSLYRASLDVDRTVHFDMDKGRSVFIYLVGGTVFVNGISLEKCDQARITGEDSIKIDATTRADFILIDTPAVEL